MTRYFIMIAISIFFSFGCGGSSSDTAETPPLGEPETGLETPLDPSLCPQAIDASLIDTSCPDGGISYLPAVEDVFASVKITPRPSANPGIDSSCSEDVNLRTRPGSSPLPDLNYLSEWFVQKPNDGKERAAEHNYFPHLVTNWNLNLITADDPGILSKDVRGVALQLHDEAGNCSSAVVPVCGQFWNMKFLKTMKNVTMDVVIVKNDGSKSTFTYGPFTVGKAWYARPKAGGPYGTGDGTSYADAFAGLDKLAGNLDKVEPQDTVFIAGLHVFDFSYKPWSIGLDLKLLKSGISPAEQIVYRGDYPGDRGVVWGAGRFVDGGVQWSKVANGIYKLASFNLHYYDNEPYFFEKIGVGGKLNHFVLARAMTMDALKAYPGSYLLQPAGDGTDVLYVHTSDNSSPDGKIYHGKYGHHFLAYSDYYKPDVNAVKFEYITFKNLILFSQQHQAPTMRLSHVRWDGCKFAYGYSAYSPLWFEKANDHIDIVDSEISCAGNGIYSVNQVVEPGSNDAERLEHNQTLKYYVIARNYIHDIGLRGEPGCHVDPKCNCWRHCLNNNEDEHGVALQGTSYGYVEDNWLVNVGTGPILNPGPDQDAVDNIFRRNFIKIGGYLTAEEKEKDQTIVDSDGRGLAVFVATGSQNFASGRRTGNVVEKNILEDCSFAFLNGNFEKNKEFDNYVLYKGNVVYNCRSGVTFFPPIRYEDTPNSKTVGSHVIFRNNFSKVEDTRLHFNSYITPDIDLIESDGNLFSQPSAPHIKKFSFRNVSKTLEEWQKSTCDGCLFDPNSRYAADDELFKALTDLYNEFGIPDVFRRKTK